MAEQESDLVEYQPLPQASLGSAETGACLEAVPHTDILILRGWWADSALIRWFKQQFGCAPPKAGNVETLVRAKDTIGRVVWQGPDCLWLFLAEGQQATDWSLRLREQTGDLFISVVGVSHYYASLTLSGARAQDCLRQGSPFDWRNLAVGNGAVFTVFYKSSILVERPAQDEYRITVRVSHAPYLWAHLGQAIDSLAFLQQ